MKSEYLKILILNCAFLLIIFKAEANPGLTPKPANPRGINIKLSPALFWNTLGLEFEFPFTKKLSASINLMGKLGRTDGRNTTFKVKEEAYLKDGYLGELSFRYYFAGKAPEGIYIQANFTYSNILYFDGTTRPYTLHNHWKDLNGLRTPADFPDLLPYSGGLGLGYQVVIIPEHLIGNLMLGAQSNIDQEGNPLLSVYLYPSIGFKF